MLSTRSAESLAHTVLIMATVALAGCSHARLAATRYRWVPSADLRAVAGQTRAPSATAEHPAVVDATPGVRGWSKSPVSLIAREEERSEFAETSSDADRKRFMAEFWQRRDPDPADTVNEYRQEFERRVATADAAFGSENGPGWSTPFGIALLVFGFPYDVSVSSSIDNDLATHEDAFAVPSKARGGDRVVWRYGIPRQSDSEDQTTSIREAAGARAASVRRSAGAGVPTGQGIVAPSIGYVLFQYRGGVWRMDCGTGLIARSMLATGIGYGSISGNSNSGSARGPAGTASGFNEVAMTAPEVPGSGTSVMGPLLDDGRSVYGYSVPLISAGCLQLIDYYLVQTIRGIPYD